ncbi:hypothetical protein Tco_0966638 [Tanacetum coccineum]
MYYPRFTKAIIHHFLIQEKSLSWRNKIGMHTSKDDYLINSLRFVSAKESTQIYGAILPECLTSPAMKESKAYKTYLGYATGKRVKRPAKKSTNKPAAGVVIREARVETKSITKEKEKVDVTRGKGIELLSEVALIEEAQMKEVRKKSLRDFHKTHHSGSGTDCFNKTTQVWYKDHTMGNDDDDSNNDQDLSNEDNEQENESEEQVSDSEQESRTPDDEYTPPPPTLSRPSRPPPPHQYCDKGIVQGEDADAEMIDAQQQNENLDTNQEQVVKDAHVTISNVMKKTKVPVTSSSRSSDLASKFLIFLDISHTDAEIVTLLDVHVYHEVPRTHAPTLLTIPEVSNFALPVIEALIKESHDEVTLAKVSSQPHSTYKAASTLTEFELKKILLDKIEKSESYLAAPEHLDCYDSLKKSYDLDKDFFFSYDVYSLKRSRKDKDEDPSARSDRGLKKRKLSKDAEPTIGPKKKDSMSGSSKGTKSQLKSSGKSVQSEEPMKETASRRDWFKKPTPPQEPTDPDWHVSKTTEEGPPQKWLMTLAASTPTDKSLKDFDELMSTPTDFSSYILNGLKIRNLTQEVLLGPAFRLLKGTRSNYAELEYDFEECYKALLEKLDWENLECGDYPFDLSKPLPLIMRRKRQRVPFEYFINNDLKYLQGGVSTMTYTTSTTKTKAAQYDLPVTHVKVMRKHRYGYLEEIVVRRADNALYRFKEGDFPQLWINDIEDMLLFTVLNLLTNLSGDDVADFAIALRMFTKSMVIQKRVKDLQLGVDALRELYKFSDGTLTRLLSSLEDITKNINMEYLLKRRWSTLEKKRAHFMIKDINKLLKEIRMMKSLEKFVGGRLYRTDLRLLQRTI